MFSGRASVGAALGLVASWGLAAGPVLAEDELYLSATNKLEYRRFSQDDLREDAFRNRLEVTATQGIFTAWARLEALSLSNAQFYDPFGWLDDDDTESMRAEESEITRRQFSVDTDQFDAQVGDFASVFGRGLMLSVFEEEELNWDTRLDGLRGVLDHEHGRAFVVAGSNEDNRFRGAFVEPNSWYFGDVGSIRTGVGAVEAWGAESQTNISPREQHFGGLLEVVFGTEEIEATVYGEYMERKFPGKDGLGARGTPGRGAFVAGEVTWSSVTASGEYRDFFRMEHDYNDPPTTLRQHAWTLLNRQNGVVLADIPDDDVVGALGQLEYAYDPYNTAAVSYATVEDDNGDRTFFEAYGEVKAALGEKVSLTLAGAESELELFEEFEERITGAGEVITYLDDVNSLTVTVEWAEVQVANSATAAFEFPEEFRDRIVSVSYGRAPYFTITGTYEDTTEDDPAEPSDEWFNVFAEINVSASHDLALTYGSERGGWKCTGGVCFFEPEFEGFKVKWIARF